MQENINTAVLVAIGSTKNQEETHEHLDELSFLAETAGIQTIQQFVQNLPHPENRFFVGKGKLEEIRQFVQANQVKNVIFDDDLSPSQLRNLENTFNPKDVEQSRIRIYDRSLLILDIFLFRAQTAQAKTQVELARNQYLLPRLTRLWTHLERQRGGTGTRGGAGEREIETDRRNIKYRITLLKEQLEKIERQRETQRKSRANIVRVALVGYTNVGKSTLMNILSKTDLLAENKLFATVDSTVRKVSLENLPFLLSDTVGFIRKLPTHLIESFKSTLDEVKEADILLHVVDVSHPFHDNQIDVVTKTLSDIGASHIPTILVLNKIDAYRQKHPDASFEEMKGYYRQKGFEHVIFVSATAKENLDGLKRLLYEEVKIRHLAIYPNFLDHGQAFTGWEEQVPVES
jgi:GTP-binding protein HflX